MSTKINELPSYVGTPNPNGDIPISINGVTYRIRPNKIGVGGSLETLSDVALSSQTNGQVLAWNSTTNKWENITVGGVGTPTLDQVITAGNSTNKEIVLTGDDDNTLIINGNTFESTYGITNSKTTINGGNTEVSQFDSTTGDGYCLQHQPDVLNFIKRLGGIIKSTKLTFSEPTSLNGVYNFRDLGSSTKDVATTDDITATNADALKRDGSNANSDVNIGSNSLYSKELFVYDSSNTAYGKISLIDRTFVFFNDLGESLGSFSSNLINFGTNGWSNIRSSLLSTNRYYDLPDKNGTFAMLDDVTGGTLQSVTDTGNETVNEIISKDIANNNSSIIGNGTIAVVKDNYDYAVYISGDQIDFTTLRNNNLKGSNGDGDITLNFPTKTGIFDIATTDDIPTNLAELTDDSTHRLVTDTEKSTWNDKLSDAPNNANAYVRSALGWVIGYTKSAIDTLLGNKVDKVTGSRLITSAESTILGNTSGTNTGDETISTIKTKLGITTLSGSNTGDETLTSIATINHSATAKTTLVDADELTGQNSSSSFSLIRFTALNLYNYLKGKFDSVYTTTSAVATQITTALSGYATQSYVNSQGFLTTITSSQVGTALGFTPYKYINTTQTNVVNTTSETIISTATIPGGTFNSNDVMKLLFKTTKTVTTTNATIRIKINTSNTLSGAVQIATYTFTSANLYTKLKRDFDLSGGNINGYSATSSAITDDATFSAAQSSNTYNPANTLYVFFTVQLGTALLNESITLNLANITN